MDLALEANSSGVPPVCEWREGTVIPDIGCNERQLFETDQMSHGYSIANKDLKIKNLEPIKNHEPMSDPDPLRHLGKCFKRPSHSYS